jgi:hypothetical protein
MGCTGHVRLSGLWRPLRWSLWPVYSCSRIALRRQCSSDVETSSENVTEIHWLCFDFLLTREGGVHRTPPIFSRVQLVLPHARLLIFASIPIALRYSVPWCEYSRQTRKASGRHSVHSWRSGRQALDVRAWRLHEISSSKYQLLIHGTQRSTERKTKAKTYPGSGIGIHVTGAGEKASKESSVMKV